MVYWHNSRISYCFGVIRHFIFGWQLPIPTNFRGVLGKTPPNFRITHVTSPKGSSLHQIASFELLCAKIGSRVWAVALLKNKKSHSTRICWPPRGVSTAHWTQTKFGRAGNLSNDITHAKFQIDWNKIVTLAKGWIFMFQHYLGGRH